MSRYWTLRRPHWHARKYREIHGRRWRAFKFASKRWKRERSTAYHEMQERDHRNEAA